MQDVDRPADIQALAQPARARRPCVEAEALCDVPGPEDPHRIGGHRGRRRHLGQRPAVRPPELERAVGLSINLVALLVDRAVVPATEQCKVERPRAPKTATDLLPQKIEKSIAFSVMNSTSAGVPSRVLATARLMAGTISFGSITRSPQPPSAFAKSA